MTPKILREKRAAAVAEARTLMTAATAASRDLSADEQARVDTLTTEAEGYGQRIAAAERFEAIEAAANAPGQRASNPLAHEDTANTRDGRHAYSVIKALREHLHLLTGQGRGLTGLEAEVHAGLAQRKAPGSPVQGVLIPWTAGAESRTTLNTTTGTGSIPTILATAMIDLLRARMVTVGMGATVLEGMQGLFSIPRQNQAGTAYWVAEGTAPTTSNQTIDQVAFVPKTVGAFTDYTRRFLEQTNQDAEAFVRNDLSAIVARGVETAGLNGSGSSNQPTGILNLSSISTVAIGTNGGAPTWAAIVGLESNVATANADMGALGYITDAAVRGKLKQTAKIGSTFPVFLWDAVAGATPVNGYKVGITNLLPTNLVKGTLSTGHAMLYGNWADLIYAFWSGIDILVDPYTGSSTGNVRIVALQDVDINVRHKESFSVCVDIDPT